MSDSMAKPKETMMSKIFNCVLNRLDIKGVYFLLGVVFVFYLFPWGAAHGPKRIDEISGTFGVYDYFGWGIMVAMLISFCIGICFGSSSIKWEKGGCPKYTLRVRETNIIENQDLIFVILLLLAFVSFSGSMILYAYDFQVQPNEFIAFDDSDYDILCTLAPLAFSCFCGLLLSCFGVSVWQMVLQIKDAVIACCNRLSNDRCIQTFLGSALFCLFMICILRVHDSASEPVEVKTTGFMDPNAIVFRYGSQQ